MGERLQKHLRTFVRDYWNGTAETALHTNRVVKLSSDIKIASVITAIATGAVALCFPHLLAGALMAGAALFTSLAAWRTVKVKNSLATQTVAMLALAGEKNDFTTLSGPSLALRTVINTQRMLDSAMEKYAEYGMPSDIRRKLTPYFNDCAEAAAQLTAEVGGKPLEYVGLTRWRLLTDDYDGIPVGHYRENVIEMPTRDTVKKMKAAENAASVAQTLERMQAGLGQTLTVKRIKLKVRA